MNDLPFNEAGDLGYGQKATANRMIIENAGVRVALISIRMTIVRAASYIIGCVICNEAQYIQGI
jgi:hypothetical protein